MKVLVCGGRHYCDHVKVAEVLTRLAPTLIIEGGAEGADAAARQWGVAKGVHVATVPALWGTHGRRAGPLRNQKMLGLQPDLVVAFPGGAGTASMVRLARASLVPVLEIA